MQEVYGERVLSKPKEIFVRKYIFGARREMNSESDEFETEAGIKAGGLVFSWENPLRHTAHRLRPTHPFSFVLGVRCEEKTNKNEDRRENTRWPFAGLTPGNVTWML